MKTTKSLLPYLIIIVAVVFIRTFIITPVRVTGNSMYPGYKDGDIMILKKFDKKIDRFDVVVLTYNGEKLIKRVIGLPGEYIEYKNSKLYVNGEQIDDVDLKVSTDDFTLDDLGYDVIPENFYFVLGDNRPISQDSRIIGLVSKESILGTTDLRIWPLNKIGIVK